MLNQTSRNSITRLLDKLMAEYSSSKLLGRRSFSRLSVRRV